MEQDSKKDIAVTLAVLLAIVFIVTAVIIKNKKTTTASGTTTTVSSADSSAASPSTSGMVATTNSTDMSPAMMNPSYKDGSYTATSDFYTPADVESITVKVTLKDGVVTGTSATATANNRDSRAYASAFVNNYKSYVIDKSIASLRLSRVSGASLTTQGFNDAIATIESQSQA